MEKMDSSETLSQLEQWITELDLLTRQRLNIKNDDLIGVNILMLIQRIFNGYKATKLLIRNGFFLEASTVVRSVIETVFVFNAIMDKPEETILKMEQLANKNKKDFNRKALKYYKLKGSTKQYDYPNLDAKKINVYDFVDLTSKNTQLYDIAYKMLCNEVHLNQASLEKILEINKNVIVAIKANHDSKDFDITYFTLFYCLHSVLTDLNQRYTLGLDSQLNSVDALLEKALPK